MSQMRRKYKPVIEKSFKEQANAIVEKALKEQAQVAEGVGGRWHFILLSGRSDRNYKFEWGLGYGRG